MLTAAFRTASCRWCSGADGCRARRATARRPVRCSASNGWQGTWVSNVLPYWHFHTRGHEVLACVSGRARIGFGGDHGIEVDVETGDVCVIPAGVGHIRLDSSGDFRMAGGYPPGQAGNIIRPGDLDDARIAREIAALALPETDPISGKTDGVVEVWRAVRP